MMKLSRAAAIAAIRRKLLDLVDDDHSMCRVAADRGIFCQGFRKLEADQLRERYSWLLRRNPKMSREELEDLANRWQLARQIVDKVPIACDAQAMEKDACGGWEDFDNATIARYYKELVGQEVEVAGTSANGSVR